MQKIQYCDSQQFSVHFKALPPDAQIVFIWLSITPDEDAPEPLTCGNVGHAIALCAPVPNSQCVRDKRPSIRGLARPTLLLALAAHVTLPSSRPV